MPGLSCYWRKANARCMCERLGKLGRSMLLPYKRSTLVEFLRWRYCTVMRIAGDVDAE
jgi:hypothetical protein